MNYERNVGRKYISTDALAVTARIYPGMQKVYVRIKQMIIPMFLGTFIVLSISNYVPC